MKAKEPLYKAISSASERHERHDRVNPISLPPLDIQEKGSEILEEIANQLDAQDTMEAMNERENSWGIDFAQGEEDLLGFLQDLMDIHGQDLIEFLLLKFGLVTSQADSKPLQGLNLAQVGNRILDRFQKNPQEFQEAFGQVVEEEIQASELARYYDLQGFEDKTYGEIEELGILSGNPVIEELLQFIDDLDRIFEKKSFIFSFLENRYAKFFDLPNLTPQYLAVQICLDYLTYREQYQLGIIAEYESLLNGVDKAPALIEQKKRVINSRFQ